MQLIFTTADSIKRTVFAGGPVLFRDRKEKQRTTQKLIRLHQYSEPLATGIEIKSKQISSLLGKAWILILSVTRQYDKKQKETLENVLSLIYNSTLLRISKEQSSLTERINF